MTTLQAELAVHLTRVVPAKREAVFAAWTQSEVFPRWFVPEGRTLAAASLDARAGGAFRILMPGDRAVAGSYRDVAADERLQFTWNPDASHRFTYETVVTVEFRDVADGTEVAVTHQGFANDADRSALESAWRDALDGLAAYAGRADYARTVEIAAPRERVYALIAGAAGVSRWWTTMVSGSGEPGGEVRVDFGKNSFVRLRIERAEAPSLLVWSPVECTPAPDWVGTRIVFALEASGAARSVLQFRHEGLTPAVECFEMCQRGWDYFIPSLVAEAERGAGQPKQVA